MAFKASATTVFLLSLTLVLFTSVSAQSPPPPPPSCPTNLTVCLSQPNNPECCRILAGLGINARVCLCRAIRNLNIGGINIGALISPILRNIIVNVILRGCNITVLPGTC
ncbi:hypothetical protein F3Y22_tig00014370pilonHSYRG00069 [Hibiscus syriacus]|uniref:Bifunctional inhibitor/plant lipid transfer protein/seed storage helical domain-containing protein n=1 Tax=Hibiscus syriacus TaxID=106335 RepID=A0A6A3C504_HIBSY|nr:hypothetical protein F3Y22_tig00014370pilonHSYRG00061 [Hibiscus syriacus]KAE8722121.1 hypothetical protein F3Y22_tig00014370pilonHSYRG00069 [Hibiscus syriacus]